MNKGTAYILKNAGKVYLRFVLALVLCGFLFLSMSVLTLGLLGSNVGYRISEQTESGQVIIVKEYYYELGEAEVKSMELPDGQRLEQIREVSPAVQKGADIVTLILMLLIMGAFQYSMLWNLGDKDSVGVRYKGEAYDRLRGLKIGLLGTVPTFVLYVLLWLSKFGLITESYLPIYRLINIPFLPYINLIIPSDIKAAAGASVWQILAVAPIVLVVPAVCFVAYVLGSKQISLHERMTYKGITKGNADTEI